MAEDDPQDLSRGFALAAEDAERMEPSASQPGLFGGEIADADGRGVRRGAGRPPGAKNRRSTEWRDFLLTRFRSPLIGMAEIASADPAALAEYLGLDSAAAAVPIIQTAQRDLAPYLHEKRGLAADGAAPGGFQIVIQTGEAGSGTQTIEARPIQQNQALSEGEPGASEPGESER